MKTNATFFCKRAQNEQRFTFLEAMKVHMTQIQSFYKLKMLKYAQIQIVASQMSQQTAVPFSARRANFFSAVGKILDLVSVFRNAKK